MDQVGGKSLDIELQQIMGKYPKVFSTSAGRIAGYQVRLYLKEHASPVSFKNRKVPFPLMEAVEKDLDAQVREGILVKVDFSEWATPIVVVPKSNREVRICGDYKVTINPFLKIDEHPLPTMDELFSKMAGGEKFTKIDLSNAYLQFEIHPDNRHLLTLTTHKGLYQPTRMMYGIAPVRVKWQRFMEALSHDIPGVAVIVRRPANNYEVRAFVGLINYYGRFMYNLSTILFPINQLLQVNVPFKWYVDCERAFEEVKKQMSSDTVLIHYDPKLPLVLAVDASPYGVGAVLSHTYPDGTEKPIQFASQTLSKVQQRYSQIDKEAYAIIYGVKKFYQYIFGRKFTLVTDNKPISQIFWPF